MQTTKTLALLIMLGMATATGAEAQTVGESTVRLPGDIAFKAPPKGPGPEMAVLYGDPSKPGVFVARVRFPQGYKVMPSWRPDEWRTAVVLSGTFFYGIGEQWDETKLAAYPPGNVLRASLQAPALRLGQGW